jgi:hypothetical protein
MKSIINHTRDLLKVIENMESQLSDIDISVSRLKTAKASITQPADNQLITWNENLSMLANSLWHLPVADGAAATALGTDGAGQLGWYGVDELVAVGLTDGFIPYYNTDHLADTDIYYDGVKYGIGTTTPRVVASYTYGAATRMVNISNALNAVRLSIQGDSAQINFVDLGGAVNDKWAYVNVDGGMVRWGSLNDNVSPRVNNILVMDMGTGDAGFGTSTPGVVASYTFPVTEHLVNIYEGTNAAHLAIQGNTGAYIHCCDLGGAANDKWLSFNVDGGVGKYLSYNDNGSVRVNNILLIDMGTGYVGVGIAPLAEFHVNGNCRVDGNIHIYSDVNEVFLGADADMLIGYDGTDANIVTDLQNPSDLVIDCGTDKTVELTEPAWEDLNFGVLSGGGPTSTLPDDVTIGNIFYKEFTSDNNQLCGDQKEVPHTAKLSDTYYPHIHIFLKSGEGSGTTGVTFTFYWELRQNGSTTNGNVTLSATSADLAAFSDLITIADATGFNGAAGVGAQLAVTLARTAGDAGDVIVTTYGIHYKVDTPAGSRQITTK